MARKAGTVYGKRANRALCSKVADFNASSSPTRTSPQVKVDDIANLTKKLESTKIDVEEKRGYLKSQRGALKPRDCDARGVEVPKIEENSGSDKKQAEGKTVDRTKVTRRISPWNEHEDVEDKTVESTPPSSPMVPRRRGRPKKSIKETNKNTENANKGAKESSPISRTPSDESIEQRGVTDLTDSSSDVPSRACQSEEPAVPSSESTPPSSPVQRSRKPRTTRAVDESPESVQASRSHISLISEIRDMDSEGTDSGTQDSDSESSHIDTEYTRPLLQYCRDPKGRRAPSAFADWSSSLEERLNIEKIAEASYGEVYRLSVSGPSSISRSDESVLKLIPLRPSWLDTISEEDQMDYEWMSTIASVTSEVQLLQRMATTPGFTNFREIRVVQGRPSKFFCNAWKAWNKAQPRYKKSEFPDPSKKISYADDQLWAVIEMQDAGTDLEHIKVDSVFTLWDIFWGVSMALAKGEQVANFEHRDLHLGNICVRPFDSSSKALVRRTYHGRMYFTNLETTIIDYTLSRADLTPSPTTTNSVAYLDLDADPAVFDGDGAEEYQYDIYRYMRSAFFTNDPVSGYDRPGGTQLPKNTKKRGPKTWEEFNPVTNVVWLHFVLHQLLTQLPTLSSSGEGDAPENRRDERIQKRALQLDRRLRRLDKTLDFRRTDRSDDERFGSACEVVEWALISHWLHEDDVLYERGVKTMQHRSGLFRVL